MHESSPYEPSPSANEPKANKASNLRGCGYGCLYAFGMWIGLSIVVALFTPIVFRGPDWDLQAIANVTGAIVFLGFAVPTGILGFIKGRRKPAESSDKESASGSQAAADLGIIAGWLMLGAVVGVVVALMSAEDARASGAIVGAWTICGGAIGLVLFIVSKLFGRQR